MILYLDTNVLVYSIAANDELREPTQRWLDWHAQQPGALLVTSRLTVLEALVGPIKIPDKARLQRTEAARLGVQRVELVFGEHGRIRQGLADVLDLEVGKVSHDVRRRHPIRHEVDDVGHGYAEPTDARAAGQNLRVLGDAIKRLRHSVLTGTLPQVLSSAFLPSIPDNGTGGARVEGELRLKSGQGR